MKYLIFSLFCFFSISAAERKFFSDPHTRHKEELLAASQTQEGLPSWWEGKHFLSSLHDLRGYFAEHGITFSSTYVIDAAGNPAGGVSQGFTQASSWGVDMGIDFGKRTPWKGWFLYSSAVWRFGTSLSASKIKNQFAVQQVFGGQTVRFVNLYLKKTFFEDKLWVKAGRLEAGNNFLQSDLYYFFTNNAFDGNPVSVFLNTPFKAFPNATWGAYLQTNPQKNLEYKAAFYNTNGRINRNSTHGLDFSFRNDEGLLLINELSFLKSPQTKKLPGHYRVGYLTFTKKKEKILGGKKRNYLAYLMVDQTLYQKDTVEGSGITPFAAFLWAPKSSSIMPFFFVSGVVAQGMIPKREKDATSFGVAYGSFSKDLRKQQKNKGEEEQKIEVVYELNHRFQINPWFYIQPMVQYVANPKGLHSVSDAWVMGFQSEVIF